MHESSNVKRGWQKLSTCLVEHVREWVSSKRGVYIFHIEMKNIRPANDIGR